MDLKIYNFDLNLSKKNFSKKNNGLNILPLLSWKNYNSNFYALILEDINAATHSKIVVHWYIPFIKINNDNSFEFLEGYGNSPHNTKNISGYFGPCPPINSGIHKYVFRLYKLDKKLNINHKNIKINSSKEFEKILKENNIKIIDYQYITYSYNSNI